MQKRSHPLNPNQTNPILDDQKIQIHMKRNDLINLLMTLPENVEIILADASREDNAPIEITSVEEIECEKEPGSIGVIFFNN